jgi:hypothetical protein
VINGEGSSQRRTHCGTWESFAFFVNAHLDFIEPFHVAPYPCCWHPGSLYWGHQASVRGYINQEGNSRGGLIPLKAPNPDKNGILKKPFWSAMTWNVQIWGQQAWKRFFCPDKNPLFGIRPLLLLPGSSSTPLLMKWSQGVIRHFRTSLEIIFEMPAEGMRFKNKIKSTAWRGTWSGYLTVRRFGPPHVINVKYMLNTCVSLGVLT